MLRCLVLAVLVGCGGGSVCKRDFCGIEPSDADVEACEAGLEGCSASDERKLSNYLDCIEEPSCSDEATTGGTEALSAFFTCLGELEGISPECSAFSTGGGSTITY